MSLQNSCLFRFKRLFLIKINIDFARFLSISCMLVLKLPLEAECTLKVGKTDCLGPLYLALHQLVLYQDSGMECPTQRSDLTLPFTHSLSIYVSVPTMCEVSCCRLDFRKTSLYLVLVIVPLVFSRANLMPIYASKWNVPL